MREIKHETFKITSSRSQISFRGKYNNVSRLKINKLVYATASANNYNMIICVSGWKSAYYNPTGQEYTFLQNLPRTSLAEVDYEAHVDHWDVVQPSTRLLTVDLECYVNGDSTNNDISPSNPLYIEFAIMLNE